MPTDPDRQKFRQFLAAQERRQLDRYLDLAVELQDSSGQVLHTAGGRWDREQKRYTGPAEKPQVIRLQPSQDEAARHLVRWIADRKAGRPRDFFALFLLGDRGGGKTFLAVVAMVMLLLDFPQFDGSPAIGWQVSKTHAERDELDREIRALFPSEWYRYTEYPKHRYHFAHGPTLDNISSDDPDTLKRGRVDFLLINEAAKMPRRVPGNGLARLKDKGGLCLLTSNPPQRVIGQWILELHKKHEEAQAGGEQYPVRFVRMMSLGNAVLDRGTADQFSRVLNDIDPLMAKADDEGLLLPIGDRSYFRWRPLLHVRPLPQGQDVAQLPDMTREFTKKRTGRAYEYLGGADFQGTPHHAAVLCKVFGTLEDPLLHAVDEFITEQGTEDDLLDQVDEAGYTPEQVLWVGDASGQWQDGQHSRNGRDSFAIFRSRRWHILPPAEKRTAKGSFSKNPPIEKRVGLINKLLGGKPTPGERVPQDKVLPVRLLVAPPPQCPKLAKALEECPWVPARYGGKPAGFYSHITDALGYVAWWVLPRPRAPSSGQILASTIPPPRQSPFG